MTHSPRRAGPAIGSSHRLDEPSQSSTEGLVERAFDLLTRVYVQRADTRQASMGLQYTEAETHDLAGVVARFTASTIEALTAERDEARQLALNQCWRAVDACGAPLSACSTVGDRAHHHAIADALNELEKIGAEWS